MASLVARVRALPSVDRALSLPWAQSLRSALSPIADAPEAAGTAAKDAATHANLAPFRFLVPSAVGGNIGRPPIGGPSASVPTDTHSLPFTGVSRA